MRSLRVFLSCVTLALSLLFLLSLDPRLLHRVLTFTPSTIQGVLLVRTFSNA